jgi:hypothetical protein
MPTEALRLGDTRSWPQARIVAVLIVLGVMGLFREAYSHFEVERHRSAQPRIDSRYRGARAFLPASGEIGYVSDERVARVPGEYETSPGTRLFLEAQYSLAPVVLHLDDDQATFVLANVVDPAELPRLLASHRLRLIARVDSGVAVATPSWQ